MGVRQKLYGQKGKTSRFTGLRIILSSRHLVISSSHHLIISSSHHLEGLPVWYPRDLKFPRSDPSDTKTLSLRGGLLRGSLPGSDPKALSLPGGSLRE